MVINQKEVKERMRRIMFLFGEQAGFTPGWMCLAQRQMGLRTDLWDQLRSNRGSSTYSKRQVEKTARLLEIPTTALLNGDEFEKVFPHLKYRRPQGMPPVKYIGEDGVGIL